jgi:hypothetical protein
MSAIWRVGLLSVSVTLGVVLGASLERVSAQASNPRLGTWKLNLAKSKYDPGPAPPRNTVKIEAAGEGEKVTTEGVNAAGAPTKTAYTAQYDGKDYPMTGSQNADTVVLKRVDARTLGTHGPKGREGGDDLDPRRLRGREDQDRHDQGHARAGASHQ